MIKCGKMGRTGLGGMRVFEYDTVNELTTQAVGGTTTTFTYSDWGRMATKTQGGYTARYVYKLGNKLKGITSNFPGETASVWPNYDGFGRLRTINVGDGDPVYRFRWAGNQMLSEYNDTNGNWEIEDSKLTYTYVHDPAMVAGAPLADLAGTNPSTGTARYYFGDNLGSTRRLRNASKTSLGLYEYQPYGEMYSESGATAKYKFAGMYYSPDLATYYTLSRYYNPMLARWTTRDPSGMDDGTNVYGYGKGRPILGSDPLGFAWTIASFLLHYLEGLGRTVDLGTIGLLATFRSHGDIKKAVGDTKAQCRPEAQRTGRRLCSGDSGGDIRSGTFSLTGKHFYFMLFPPALFVMGKGALAASSSCKVIADCCNETFGYTCTHRFDVNDWFDTPLAFLLGVDTEFGTPYKIGGSWSESSSGTGYL
jgi:RHS repeat-associated protein